MKATLGNLILPLLVFAAFLGSTAARAQGRIVFGNASVPTQKILDGNFHSPSFGAPLVAPAGTYEFGLYIGPAGSSEAELRLVGVAFNLNSTTTAAPAGLFNGGNPYVIPATPGVALDGSAPIAFMIKGWEASQGSSFEAALMNVQWDANTLFGKSVMGSITPTPSPTLAPQMFGSGPGQIQGFYMYGALSPEPSTLALGGLGAVAMILFRRRG